MNGVNGPAPALKAVFGGGGGPILTSMAELSALTSIN